MRAEVFEQLRTAQRGQEGERQGTQGEGDREDHRERGQQIAGGRRGGHCAAPVAGVAPPRRRRRSRYRTISAATRDRKSTRLNSSHVAISYAVFCLKKKTDYIYNKCFILHDKWID